MDQASSTLCCWRRGLFIRGHFSFRFVQWLMVGTLPALRADPSPPPLPPAPRAPGSGLRPLLPAPTQARLSLSPSHRILGGLVCSRLCHPLYQKGCRGTSCPPKPRAWMLEARWILSESQISTRWRPKRPRHCSPRPPHFLRILRFLRMMLLSSVDGKQSLGVTLDAYCLSSRPCWVTPPGCCHHHFFPVLLLFRTS